MGNFTKLAENFLDGGHKYDLQSVCRKCGQARQIIVDAKSLFDYNQGRGYAQDLFPEVSVDDRELFFMSGVCGLSHVK